MPSRSCARAATAISRRTPSRSCSSIDEGPRIYIERINVRGNTRTRDYVIRREFDLSEGDAYNRALVDRAERRLKNLDFFKTRQDHRPSRAPRSDRVDPDRRSRREIDRRLLGLGRLFDHRRRARRSQRSPSATCSAAACCQGIGPYGQYARGYSLSFVEPYLLDYRVALGLDLFQRQQLANQLHLLRHQDARLQPAARLQLREDLSLQLRYSIYQQEIRCRTTLTNCNNNHRLARRSTRRRPLQSHGARRNGLTELGGSAAATSTAKPRCRSARNCRAARR